MHKAETGASRRFPRVLKNSRVLIELNNALGAFYSFDNVVLKTILAKK